MEHNITVTIDDKIYKLVYSNRHVSCHNCSLYMFCNNTSPFCPAVGLGGEYFVELKIEK